MTQSRQLWDAKALESAPRPKVSFHDFEDAAGPSKRIRGSMVSLMSHLVSPRTTSQTVPCLFE
jgi:hypothetical protein